MRYPKIDPPLAVFLNPPSSPPAQRVDNQPYSPQVERAPPQKAHTYVHTAGNSFSLCGAAPPPSESGVRAHSATGRLQCLPVCSFANKGCPVCLGAGLLQGNCFLVLSDPPPPPHRYMQQSIRAFSWVHRVSDPSQSTLTPALVQSISESSSQIFVLAEDGLNRCLEFTQGVESQGFLNTLNDIFVEYSELIGKLVKQQLTAPETVAAATPPKSPVDGGVISPKSAGVASEPATPVQPAKRDSSTVKVGLHLHQMCATMNTKLDKFEMVAKSAIFSKRQEMSGEASPLLRDNPGKATTLAYFLNSMESLKIPVFSLATKHLQLLRCGCRRRQPRNPPPPERHKPVSRFTIAGSCPWRPVPCRHAQALHAVMRVNY